MAVNQLKSDLDMDTILILCSAIVDNAAKWKHEKGGVIRPLENFDAQAFRKWLDDNYKQSI